MRLPFSSLRFRLTASIVLSGLVGLFAAVGILADEFRRERERVEQNVSFQADVLAHALYNAVLMGDADKARAQLETMGVNGAIAEAHLFDNTAKGLASFYSDFRERGKKETLDPGTIPIHAKNWIVVPVRGQDVIHGTLAVHFRDPRLLTSFNETAPLLFLLLLGTGLAILLLNRWVQRSVLKPVLGLSEAAEIISQEKDYSIRALRMSEDEIGQLVDTFNGMLTQIELRDLELHYEMERAEAATLAKSQFLATMSHELRTPMNGVIGMSELLADTPLTADQRVFAETIQSSATGLLAIINDILDFSKIESGHLELEDTEIDLRRVVEDSVGTLAHTAHDRGLVLLHRIDDEVPVHLRGDPSRLRQVLLNLLSNALKFTHEGEVELRVTMESDEFHAVILRFEIEDTGIGIPEDRMDRLFKSFSQVDVSDTRKYGGTGLGLAISKEIVSGMGGEVDVRSTVGLGSTFSFTARLGRAESLTAESTDLPARPVRVLVAHPHPKQREAVEYLIGTHHEVEVCADVESCRAALAREEFPIELAFVDMDFLASADHPAHGLFEHDMQREGLKIVLLTNVRQASEAARLKGPAIRGFVALPARHGELHAWLQATLDGVDVEQQEPETSWAPDLAAPDSEGEGPGAPAPRPSGQDGYVVPPGTLVLVAEDNPVNQRVVTRFLQKLGAECVLACDGREAVRRWRDRTPTLVLMDLQMPEMDGLEATREIRRLERPSGRHTPIVALTANVGEEVRQRCRQAGMDGHLSKPFQLRELRAVLERCIEDLGEDRLGVEPAA